VFNLHDQSSAIESLPAPSAVKINGNGKAKATGAVVDFSKLDAIWANLPENIKARILNLANGAAR
jgi:hypothetical protein